MIVLTCRQNNTIFVLPVIQIYDGYHLQLSVFQLISNKLFTDILHFPSESEMGNTNCSPVLQGNTSRHAQELGISHDESHQSGLFEPLELRQKHARREQIHVTYTEIFITSSVPVVEERQENKQQRCSPHHC